MRGMRVRWVVAATLLSLVVAPGANAGQQWVKVGQGGSLFAPDLTTLNRGDHVTWVWVGFSHTVTSGLVTNGDPFDPIWGQGFDTPVMNPGDAFTWKADTSASTVDYFCRPHWPSMLGQLDIRASGFSVASFRITEVQYNEATGKDRIEIANLGGDPGDLGRYRIAVNGSTSQIVPLNTVFVLSGASPGRVVIHTNEGTTGSTQADLFMGGIGNLPTTGSIALYVPNTSSSLTDPKQIIDFVQWGAGNQPNAATAVSAGVWPSTGEFVDLVPVTGDYDLVFCGAESQHGASEWKVAHPNFRSGPICSTPTVTTSWGRIKQIYR